MRLSIASALLTLAASTAQAASSWGFSDGAVTVASKGAEGVTEKFTDNQRITKPVTLGSSDSLKVSLTAKAGSKAKRPHQAFLMVKESSGLEAPYPLTIKESGKGTVEITQKDLPVQLLLSSAPLEASVVLGSFGSTAGSVTPVFEIQVEVDANAPLPSYSAPVRYGKMPEIHHIFRDDPKSPPKIVSIVFSLAVLATIPALLIGLVMTGANLSHLQKAMSIAPISHLVFFGSIVGMEGVFFLYYSSWNLFQTLPALGLVGAAAFLSGTRALGEVQGRRLAGER